MPTTLGAQGHRRRFEDPPPGRSLMPDPLKTSFFEIRPNACKHANLGIVLMRDFRNGSSLFTMSVNLPTSFPVRSGTPGGKTCSHADEAERCAVSLFASIAGAGIRRLGYRAIRRARPVGRGEEREFKASLVEPDGIEPTTSCLQSRRSPS